MTLPPASPWGGLESTSNQDRQEGAGLSLAHPISLTQQQQLDSLGFLVSILLQLLLQFFGPLGQLLVLSTDSTPHLSTVSSRRAASSGPHTSLGFPTCEKEDKGKVNWG